MEIKKMKNSDIAQVCDIDINNRQNDFLVSLGKRFLILLYSKILVHEKDFCFVSVEGDKVRGFIIGSGESQGLLKNITMKNRLRFALALIAVIFKNPPIVLRILETLKYASKSERPHAELMVLGVDSSSRRQGIGRSLVETMEKAFKSCGINRYRVVVNTDNAGANEFYEKTGFAFIYDFNLYGKVLNCYEKVIG